MEDLYSFKDDYSEGAHSRILEALKIKNSGQSTGYGEDRYSLEAIQLIKEHIRQPDAFVHFVSGGTQANLLILTAILRPYESVIAAATSHIAVHETGSIEATGHQINQVQTADGKLNPELIDREVKRHVDEHMVKPRAVFISQSTELGTLYSAMELKAISGYCRAHGLYLYLDGARLAAALTARTNDMTLPGLADLVDVFYIGGTKNGGLLGEAIVINNPELQPNFRYLMKQKGALLAKGRIFGIQFIEMFRDGLFWELGQRANSLAEQMVEGIRSAGYSFWMTPVSNQIFPIFPDALIDQLREEFDFYVWKKLDEDQSVIRLVTSWATTEIAIQNFIERLR